MAILAMAIWGGNEADDDDNVVVVVSNVIGAEQDGTIQRCLQVYRGGRRQKIPLKQVQSFPEATIELAHILLHERPIFKCVIKFSLKPFKNAVCE